MSMGHKQDKQAPALRGGADVAEITGSPIL